MIEFKNYDCTENNLCACDRRKLKKKVEGKITTHRYKCKVCNYTCTFNNGTLVSIMVVMPKYRVFLYKESAFIIGAFKKYINYPLIKFPTELSEIKNKLEKVLILI